jgi:hypothetical protein
VETGQETAKGSTFGPEHRLPDEYRLSHDDAGRCCLYAVPNIERELSAPEGPRETARLSSKGVRVMMGSNRKAAMIGRPMRALWTFTVKPTDEGGRWEHPREAVADGDLVLSQEIRRFMDAFRKYLMRQDRAEGRVIREARLVRNEATGRWRTVEPVLHGDLTRIEYIWVAENPLSGSEDERNDRGRAVKGTRNPHVHMLVSWTYEPPARLRGQSVRAWKRAKHEAWLDFAAYVEGLWGLGWVHMEYIREPLAAGKYLLKCARYLGKGADASRPDEPLYGQRWAVSRDIRPIRTVEPVEISADDATALYAARRLAESKPRRFGDMLIVNRYALSGFDIQAADFLSLVRHLASGGWLLRNDEEGAAAALVEAEQHVADRLAAARADEAFYAAADARFFGSLEVVGLYDRAEIARTPCWAPLVPAGRTVWEQPETDPYDEDPDLADLLPVA